MPSILRYAALEPRPLVRLAPFASVFFVSGASALVYQVAWQRILALHTGVGIYSVAVIVAAFMAGLGLGSALGGAASARLAPRRALLAFAGVELAVAGFGAASTFVYYDWLYLREGWLYTPAWRGALLHFASLAVPTTLMGTSLPFLVRALVGEGRTAGRTIGILYGVNVLGAAAGALVTPWVLVRHFGIRGAVAAAAVGNVAAGLGALAAARAGGGDRVREGGGALARAEPVAPVGPPDGERAAARPFALWLALYALSGFCALALEVVWFRVIDVAVKSTAFTFGTVLTVYLLGYGAGSLAGAGRVARVRRPLLAFVACQCALLACSGAAVAVLVHAPRGHAPAGWFDAYWAQRSGFELGEHWDAAVLTRLYLGLPLVLYGVPTFLMGLSFPILQRAVQDDPRTSGRKVGFLQAANIAGCVAGSLSVGLLGFTLLGTTGVLRVLMGAGIAFAAVGIAAYGARPLLLGGAAVLALLAAVLPGQEALWLRLHGSPDPARSILAEDATGLGAIVPDGPTGFRVYVDGKSHSWVPFGGIHTWLGAIPAAIHESPSDVAIVGLGSGNTAWAAGCRAETRRVTVFELSRSQGRLLGALSARSDQPELRGLLADPRLRVVTADGRNALERGAARYDVIQADALWPNIAYSGNLYSVEFFSACRDRLKPGGLMCTWAPTPRAAASFQAAFPHVLAFLDGSVLVGSLERLPARHNLWRERMEAPAVVSYLGPGVVRLLVRNLKQFQRLEDAPAVPPNHDLFPRDEFATP